MELDERLRKSEQSRHLAWQVLQEIRRVLEILDDQRIPYEGGRKRFRAVGDFLIRALVDVVVQCRSQIGRLEIDLPNSRNWPVNMSGREMLFKQCIT